jgi:hypothetical protein
VESFAARCCDLVPTFGASGDGPLIVLEPQTKLGSPVINTSIPV